MHANGVLGKDLANEGDKLAVPGTVELSNFSVAKGKIRVNVWDSRGLLDGRPQADQERGLQEMADNCAKVHLKLFCMIVSQCQ